MKPLQRIAILAALVAALPAAASQALPPFVELEAFPAPAEFAFGVTADALRDGRFIAYDGLSVFVQDARGSDAFSLLATGFPGDPGFISVSPDGRFALLGAGFLGEIWVLDLEEPADSAAPAAVLEGNFSAAWLTEDRVVINRATQPDPSEFIFEAELGILDLGVEPVAYDIVVRPAGGASGDIAISPDGERLYTADGLTGGLRIFAVTALLEAAGSGSILAWEDGDLLGTYNTGGPFGITPDGRNLFVGGADPFEFTGSIQVVDADSGEVLDTFNPSGDPGTFSSGAIAPTTGHILLVGTAFPGPEVTAFQSTRGYGIEPSPALWVLIMLHFLQSIHAFLAQLFHFLH